MSQLESDPSYALRWKVRGARWHILRARAARSRSMCRRRADRVDSRAHGRSQVRMGDIGGVRNLLKAGAADPLAMGATIRGWATLHIACWGSMKPQNDKDIVEALLMWAMKNKREDEIRGMADKEGVTALELAKTRREQFAAMAPAGGDEGGGAALEEKRKYDKIVRAEANRSARLRSPL